MRRATIWALVAGGAARATERGGAVVRALQHADANGDGRVSFDEYRKVEPNATAEQYRKLDANGDGVWSSADLSKADRRLLEGDGGVTKSDLEFWAPELPDALFELLDRDDDGVLSGADRWSERQDARTRQQWYDADLNRDGKVSWDEARQRIAGMTEERFRRLDRTEDGYLTEADRSADRAELQKRMKEGDRDGDGALGFEEARAAFPGLSKTKFDQLDRNGDGRISKADQYQGIWDVEGPAPGSVRSADVSGDGKVTYEEVVRVQPDYPREAFDRIDANGDGVVTKDEALRFK